jgi:import inner membrane translocase subunit TIM21
MKYLHGPLSFHNNPPSAIRPRHRNRHVISQIMVDHYGQEHMIMTFYVSGRQQGAEVLDSDTSYLDYATEWVQEKASKLSDLTLDESIAWTEERANDLWNKTKLLFKYLSGSPIPSSLPSLPSETTASKDEDTSAWSVAGMFSSLRGPKSGQVNSKHGDGQTFTDGQVHAHLIRASSFSLVISP